ncbi:MAG: phosphate acyltransferase PlsX [Crocinitomicaceae bacterium]|nr:phosphate acyltransferase PlsX [Crocinitomicaceae bacterium]
MRIGIDAMGGDYAPLEAIKGAVLARAEFPSIELVMFGVQSDIENIAKQENLDLSGIEIVHCSQVIEMSEHPVKALAGKRDSSISVGFEYLADKKIDSFFSAGNTGAMLVGSIQILKPIEGVDRPCLTSAIPRPNGNAGVLLDVGANADCKPEHLQQFAILGSLYAQAVKKIDNPSVGLLNIGEEDEKGSILSRAANLLLRNTPEINFFGNVEGRDLFNDDTDVIVCDGFSGNVVIKLVEGLYYQLMKRGVQDEFLNQFNFKHHGGGLILGVKAPVLVGHGISKADTFLKMVEVCKNSVESNFCARVESAFQKIANQQNTSN